MGNDHQGDRPDAQPDKRIAYGVRCTWWGSIYNVGVTATATRLPCCPYCGGPLFEMSDENLWWAKVYAYAHEEGDSSYPKLIELTRERECFKSQKDARGFFNLWPSD